MSGFNLEMSSYSHMNKFEKRKNTNGCLQVPKNFLNGKTPLYTLIYFLGVIHSIMSDITIGLVLTGDDVKDFVEYMHNPTYTKCADDCMKDALKYITITW